METSYIALLSIIHLLGHAWDGMSIPTVSVEDRWSDMVLGVDWLSQFNLLVFDFQRGRIKGMEVELRSEVLSKEFLMMKGR